MNKQIDLHVHTYYSDGHYSPSKIIELASIKNLSSISITDHDSVAGLDEAIETGKKHNIGVIPGIELSCEVNNNEIHVLGYFLDYKNEKLSKWIKEFQQERISRAEKIVSILQELGLSINFSDVKKVCPSNVIGRPHIAQAMVNLELVKNFYQAFDKYLSNDGPAFVPKYFLSINDAVKVIHDAGGLAFLAHPYKMDIEILSEILSSKIDGIETIHPSHDRQKRKYYKKLVHDHGLLESGGSDYHGGGRNDDRNFGKFFVGQKTVDFMLNMK